MRMVLALVLLSSLLSILAVPSRRPACSRRALGDLNCHSITQDNNQNLRQIQEGLQDHFWAGHGCEEICYCHHDELLCCPKDIFFGPKISFMIPCNGQ